MAESDSSQISERAERLADAGLLTGKQAEVFIRRKIEFQSRATTATKMGISPNTHDNHLHRASGKVSAAMATIVELERQRVLYESDGGGG